MGPKHPNDVAREPDRDLSALVGELAALKADAHHWLTDSEYAALRHRLEAARSGCRGSAGGGETQGEAEREGGRVSVSSP